MIDNLVILFSCASVIYVVVRAALLDRKERDIQKRRTPAWAKPE